MPSSVRGPATEAQKWDTHRFDMHTGIRLDR
jgi:hypothetical protein